MTMEIKKTDWGYHVTLEHNEKENYCIKKIVVKPGQTIGMHSYKCKSEEWIIIRGIAQISYENETEKGIFTLHDKGYVEFSRGTKHGIANTSMQEDLIFIGIVYGT